MNHSESAGQDAYACVTCIDAFPCIAIGIF